MARADHTSSLMESPVTAEETSLMDADREAENTRPESAPEPEQSEPEAAPAPVEEPTHDEPAETPEIDPATGKQRKVDYGALHAEREKRRAAEARERAKDTDLATLKGRFEVLEQLAKRSQEPQKQQADAPIEVPDINLDPVGHFQAKDAIRERELTELRNWKQAQDQQSQVMNNVKRIQELAQSHEAEFAKTTPDYTEAFQYLRQNRDMELEAMGYTDPGVRQQIINQDAIQIAAQALQTNRNAAEAVYKIAKARGWAGKQPAPSAPAPVQPHPDAAKLATIAKGQQAGQSLGQVNGGSAPISTPEMIAKMSDAEFAEKFSGNDGEANWRKLMGG